MKMEATYCRKLSKIDGHLNFELTAYQLVSRNLAFSSWPGSYFLHVDQVLKVGKITEIDGYDHLEPGQRGLADDHSLIIGTRRGAISVEKYKSLVGKCFPSVISYTVISCRKRSNSHHPKIKPN